MTEDKYELILQENERLKQENEQLLEELKNCRNDVCRQISVLTSVKKDIRRYEVQLNSLKAENEELKRKFARIENHPVGKILLKIYRILREIKRRRF